MKQYITTHRYPISLGIGVFFLIYIFFAIVHPIYPYDLDDWKIMLRVRELYPSIYEWNPTRVLPEVLMPRCGEFAMAVVYPLVGDITLSICYVTALLLSILITTYILFFYQYIRKKASLSCATSVLLSLIFLAFHFLIFRTQERENQHLFYSYDLTDHYFYTIPNILGSILVMIFMTQSGEFFHFGSSVVKKGFFLLSVYLLVFSNLFDSIILSSFLASLLLIRVIRARKENKTWKEIFKQYRLHIAIIALWLVAIGFEPFGGNAQEITTQTQSVSDALMASARNMKHVLLFQTNTVAKTSILLAITLFLVLSFKNKEKFEERETLYVLLLSSVVCTVFLVLLGAMSFPYYLLRVMSIYAVPFFIILCGFYCLAKLVKAFPKISIILPFALLFFLCNIERRGKTFQDVQTFLIPNEQQLCYQIPPAEILKQNRNNIETLITANKKGQDTLTLFVPKFKQDGNWPMSWSYGRNLSRFLLRYHLVTDKMEVKLETDPQKKDFSK